MKGSIAPIGTDSPDGRPTAADAIGDLNHVFHDLTTNVGQKYHKTPIERERKEQVGSLRAKTFIEIAVTRLIETTVTTYRQKWKVSCSRSY